MLYPATYTKPLSEDFVTDGDKLIELVRLAWRSPESPDGIQLDEWQEWLLRHMLERYPEDHPTLAGRLRFRQVCVSIPRQSGKSLLGAILGLYGLLMHMPNGGAQVLSLASSTEQAMIIYSRVLFVIQENPALRKRFKKATERRGIVTADGRGRYDVKPAKEAALQGIPISLCLFDEGHLAKRGMYSAAVLGTSSLSDDGAVFMITTAGDESSETLIDLYKQGERSANGDPELERFGFFNWTAPEGSSVTDPAAILASNPAVECGRIPLERMLSDLATIPEHEARRYRLNQFIAGVTETWLPAQLFHQAAGQGITELEGSVLGVDVTAKWEYATIAAANRREDVVETELVATFNQPTEQLLYNTIVKLYRDHKIKAIAIDARVAPNLTQRLKRNGFIVWQLYAKEVSAACSQGYALFSSGQIEHNNEGILTVQSNRAVAKYVGESWYLSRVSSFGEIDALLATLFAVYVASSKEESVIGVF